MCFCSVTKTNTEMKCFRDYVEMSFVALNAFTKNELKKEPP